MKGKEWSKWGYLKHTSVSWRWWRMNSSNCPKVFALNSQSTDKLPNIVLSIRFWAQIGHTRSVSDASFSRDQKSFLNKALLPRQKCSAEKAITFFSSHRTSYTYRPMMVALPPTTRGLPHEICLEAACLEWFDFEWIFGFSGTLNGIQFKEESETNLNYRFSTHLSEFASDLISQETGVLQLARNIKKARKLMD